MFTINSTFEKHFEHYIFFHDCLITFCINEYILWYSEVLTICFTQTLLLTTTYSVYGLKTQKLMFEFYFTLMPRPSARTKYFLSRTKLKLSKTKFLSRVKNYIFCFQKSFITKFPDRKSIFKKKHSYCMTFESKKCSF